MSKKLINLTLACVKETLRSYHQDNSKENLGISLEADILARIPNIYLELDENKIEFYLDMMKFSSHRMKIEILVQQIIIEKVENKKKIKGNLNYK